MNTTTTFPTIAEDATAAIADTAAAVTWLADRDPALSWLRHAGSTITSIALSVDYTCDYSTLTGVTRTLDVIEELLAAAAQRHPQGPAGTVTFATLTSHRSALRDYRELILREFLS